MEISSSVKVALITAMSAILVAVITGIFTIATKERGSNEDSNTTVKNESHNTIKTGDNSNNIISTGKSNVYSN